MKKQRHHKNGNRSVNAAFLPNVFVDAFVHVFFPMELMTGLFTSGKSGLQHGCLPASVGMDILGPAETL